jgi:hypothetical protein
MLQEEAPWTGLCRVLEEDPLLRMGAPTSIATYRQTTLLEFTASLKQKSPAMPGSLKKIDISLFCVQ